MLAAPGHPTGDGLFLSHTTALADWLWGEHLRDSAEHAGVPLMGLLAAAGAEPWVVVDDRRTVLAVPPDLSVGARVRLRAGLGDESEAGPDLEWRRVTLLGRRLQLVRLRASTRRTDPLAELSEALRPVAIRMAAGLSDKEIAADLERPLSTVRTYVRRVYERLGVNSRVDLARRTT